MTIRKAFRWALLTLWFIFVIFLSCQSGNDSGGLSHWLANNIFHISSETFHVILRSCAHFNIHFILAILMYAAAYKTYNTPPPSPPSFALFFPSGVELLQFFIPGRYPEFADIILNISGIMIGTLICALIAPKKYRPLY